MDRDTGMKFDKKGEHAGICTKRLIALNNRTWRIAELCASGWPTLTAYLRHLICRGLEQDVGVRIRDDLDDFEASIVDQDLLKRCGHPEWVEREIKSIINHNGREWPK